ncbi:MAG: SPOR domain-containing protein, partial [Bacteroidota bacterium]
MKAQRHFRFTRTIRASLIFGLLFGGISIFASAQSAYYHLITASFDSFEKAHAMVEDLKGQSYTPLILFPSEDAKVYRVSIYHSTNRSEVAKYQSDLKARRKRSGWILTLGNPGSPAETTAVSRGGTATARLSETGQYHLIVGSYNDFASANNLQETLKGQGYEPYIIFPTQDQKSYRVSVYQADNKGEIKAYNKLLKKRGKEKGWIYEGDASTNTTLGSGLRMATSPAPVTSSGNEAVYHLIGGSFNTFDQAYNFA